MNLTPILALLRREMGLNPASVGEGTVMHALRRRMAASGCLDGADYEARLSTSPEELQELIEEVSIPETWFFREEGAFVCLRNHVQQELAAGDRQAPFRIACLPCATGEEAYSIVMALLDIGLPPARIRVHALDISYRALLRAQEGGYGDYSFRAADKSFRTRYFQRDADTYRVAQAVRRPVSFYQGSALALPSPFNSTTYDVVFCRNMLIYLDAVARQRVMTGLKRMLSPDGILLVGHSEVSIALHEGFVRAPNGALRAGPATASPVTHPSRRKRSLPRVAKVADGTSAPRVMPFAAAAVPAIPPKEPVALTPEEIERIRVLADTGRLTEAGACCDEWAVAGVRNAELYCLQGLICNAQGNLLAARACYRKALYLDPQHEDARAQLDLIDQRSGTAPRQDHPGSRQSERHGR